ncbi:MAG: sugar ABC transporter permease [Anaerolineaceae bacterium]|nr:sugar ABC transporter permease [Anaerolineaceae bacterium]
MGAKRKEQIENVLFTLPAVILVSATIYIPFILSGYYSLTKWNGISKQPEFIGFQNFVTIFTDASSNFLNSILFTTKYTIVFIIFANIFALALAVALTQKFKLANVMRGVFFIPYIMSMTIVGFIWKFIFSQGFAKLFEMTGWQWLNLSWLGNPNLAFYSVAFVGIWQSVGFYIVLYIAGLQAIPSDILEAATVDGATGLRKFFSVTFPMLWPSVTTCVFMSLTNSLKVFDIILALTQGGPGKATASVTLEIYREAFQNNNYGLGSAESIIYFLFVLILTQVVLKAFNKRDVGL